MINPDIARIFFALWPTEAEGRALAGWQTGLRCGGRVMRPDTLHLTLLFLGNVAMQRVETLKLAVEEISGAGFELCLDEVRYWQHNHIVYAAPGVVPQALRQLVKELERLASAHEFQFEQRKYQPHITLLRNVQSCVLPEVSQLVWSVKEFVMVQSHQGVYNVLARFPLQ